jgi:hypothetical protein
MDGFKFDDFKGRQPHADRQPLRFNPVWLDEVERTDSAWIIKGVLPRAGLGALYGPPGSGKTFVVLWIAYCISRGIEVLGQRTRQAGVLYLGAEDADGLATRIAALRQEHGSEKAPFLFVPAPAGFNAADAGHMAELIATARERAEEFGERGAPVGLIIADTFNRAMPGLDENSAQAMSDAIAKLANLGRELDALVLIVHHTGKDVLRGLRGHSSLLAALDVSLEVQREGDKRTLRLVKAKNSEDGLAWPFELKPVHLGTDEDGDAISSCVAEIGGRLEANPLTGGEPPPQFRKLPAQVEIVGRTIARAISDKGASVLEIEVMEAGLAVLRDPGNEHADKAAKQAWKRGIDSLIKEQLLERDNGVLSMSQIALTRFGCGLAKDNPMRLRHHHRTLEKAWRQGGCPRNSDGAVFVPRSALESYLEDEGYKPAGIEVILSEKKAGGLVYELEAAGHIKPVDGGWIVIADNLCTNQGGGSDA